MKLDCCPQFKFCIPTPEQHLRYVLVTIQSDLSMSYMLRLLIWFYEFHVPCRGKNIMQVKQKQVLTTAMVCLRSRRFSRYKCP